MAGLDFSPPERFGDYVLLRHLGEGSTGVVVLCMDTALRRRVAVKFFKGASADPGLKERFWTEARAIARLSHPNIVAIYSVGEFRGIPYLVSEFVDGQSLDRSVRPLGPDKVLSIALGLSRGLAVAHAAHVLHRDVKPANIMLGADGTVKLLDFGLAKMMPQLDEPQDYGVNKLWNQVSPILSSTHDLLETPTFVPETDLVPGILGSAVMLETTQHSADAMEHRNARSVHGGPVFGTPLYMAPEIWRGEQASPRSDVYSLGVVLFELLAGRPPYQASDTSTLRQLVLNQPAPRLAMLLPQTDQQLAGIIDRCLASNPQARFAHGEDLAAALGALSKTRDSEPVMRFARWKWRTILPVVGFSAVALAVLHQRRTARPQGMVELKGGSFQMGSTHDEIEAAQSWCRRLRGSECDEEVLAQFAREQPARWVTIPSFRIDKTEVTNAAFAAWLNQRTQLKPRLDRYVYDGDTLIVDLYPWYQPASGIVYNGKLGRYEVPQGKEWLPVTHVTWEAARRFCLDQGKRLPSEAEWEYAARGEERRRFPWGNEEPRCGELNVARDPGQTCNVTRTGEGARGEPAELAEVSRSSQDMTPERLFDLAGNVAEWVADAFEETYPACPSPCLSPLVFPSGSLRIRRVVRGGSWNWSLYTVRAATRSRWWQDEATTNIGFRCAASLSQPLKRL